MPFLCLFLDGYGRYDQCSEANKQGNAPAALTMECAPLPERTETRGSYAYLGMIIHLKERCEDAVADTTNENATMTMTLVWVGGSLPTLKD